MHYPKLVPPFLAFVDPPEPEGGGKGGKKADDSKKSDDSKKAKKSSDPDDKKAKKSDDDDGKGAGGKDALKADLARERDKRQELEKSIDELKTGFAKALGLAPEETSDTDKLADSINKLQKRLDESDRRRTVLEVAAEHGVGKDDIHMLTATDAEGLKKQAEWIKAKNDTVTEATGKPKGDPSQGGGGKPVTGGDAEQYQSSMERALGRRPKPQE